MLSTTKEVTDISEGKETKDMTRAQLVKGAFRVLTLKLGKAGIPLLVTNHTYKQVGTMFPQDVMGGGSGIQYAASTIIFLSVFGFKYIEVEVNTSKFFKKKKTGAFI